MASVKSWPAEIEPIGMELIDVQDRLQWILKVLIREGIDEMHYSLIKIFIPKIEKLAEDAQGLCIEAMRKNPQTSGRKYKWYTVIEEAHFMMQSLEEMVDDLIKYERQHLWNNVRTCLTIALENSREIRKQLYLIPLSRNGVPVPFREAFESEQ